jgi:hypothetical protein
MCFYKLAEEANLEQNEPFSTEKILILGSYSFQNQIQFGQGNSVLDAPASNRDCFLARNTCVSSLEPSRAIWNKMSLFDLENCDLQGLLISTTNSALKVKQCALLQLLAYMLFFEEVHEFLQLSWIALIDQTQSILTLPHLRFRKFSFTN